MSLNLKHLFMGDLHRKNKNSNIHDTTEILSDIVHGLVPVIITSDDHFSHENPQNVIGYAFNFSLESGCLYGDIEIAVPDEVPVEYLALPVDYRPRTHGKLRRIGNWGCVIENPQIKAIAILSGGDGW